MITAFHRCLLVLVLSVTPALAQQSTSEPSPATAPQIKPSNFTRFVPTGEERTIGFVASVFPDCSLRGPVVGRTTKPPSHGAVSLVAADSFIQAAPGSRLEICNEKKKPGLNITYKSENGYTGDDSMQVFLMFPDGSAGEWNYTIIVK